MNDLTIADLPREEELASSSAQQISGGMSCLHSWRISDFYSGLAGVYDSMGMSQQSADATAKSIQFNNCAPNT